MNLKDEATHKNKSGLMFFKVIGNDCYLLKEDEKQWIRLNMSYIDLIEWCAIEINHNPIDWVSLYSD